MARKALLFALLLVVAVAALAAYQFSAQDRKPLPTTLVSDNYSNIHPADYVGPQSCAKCHQEQFELWQQHAHSRMNCDANDATVLGDFSDQKVEYGNGYVVFEKQAGQFLMSMFEADRLVRQYRVTRTVGSRIEQMYIGVQTQG